MIVPYFFENDEGTTVTVNSERYDHMITDLFCLILKNTSWRIYGFNKMVPHATQLDRIWIYCKTFPGHVISLFFWGYAKDRVYADKPSTLEHLQINIRQVMAELPPNMCQKVIENYLKRINACNTSHGGHVNDVVFSI